MMKTKPLTSIVLSKVFFAGLAEIQSQDLDHLETDKLTTHTTNNSSFQFFWRRDKEMEDHYEKHHNWPPTLYFIMGFKDHYNPYPIDVIHCATAGDVVYFIDGNITYEIFNHGELEHTPALSPEEIRKIIESILVKLSINGLINIHKGKYRGNEPAH